MAGQSKGRKIGNKKKNPSMKTYTSLRRWELHKKQHIEKERDLQLAMRSKVLKVPHGTARAKRREELQHTV